MNTHHKHKSVTLIELIIAIVLLSVLVIGFSSIEIFSRYHVLSADRRVKLQNNVSYALDHMTKHIAQAIGNFYDPAVVAYDDNKGIRVRIDTNSNGQVDTGDTWVAYRHENIGNPATDSEIRYYTDAGTAETPAGSYETIARQIVISSSSFYGVEFQLLDNCVEVKITVRWLPDQAASADNPEVAMTASIKMPSVTTN